MKKVVFVSPVQSPYLTERLRALVTHEDLDITLLLESSAFSHRPGWKVETISGINIEVLDSVFFRSDLKGDDLGYQIKSIRSIPWKLPMTLWRLRPDIVVLCNASQLLFALPLKMLGVRLALIVEDTPHATRYLSVVARLLKKTVYSHADHWFAFSEDAKSFLAQIGIKKKVTRSSWSLNMSEFCPREAADEIVQINRDDKKTVVFVGALTVNKGVMLLLQSWLELPKVIRESSQLILIGSGPLRQDLEKLIQANALSEVKVLGQIPYDKVRNFLKMSDLFVLPTLQDLFSLTVLEAMACGCPVITTPFNGARELVEEGKSGWIVDPTQSGQLTSILARALSALTNLENMGAVARKRVESMDNAIVMGHFAESIRNMLPRV